MSVSRFAVLVFASTAWPLARLGGEFLPRLDKGGGRGGVRGGDAALRTLLDLEDARNRRAIRAVTSTRRKQIQDKLSDLERMRATLADLLDRCRTAGHAQPCTIIETLTGRPASS